jgi:hypothetical protein
VSCGASSSSKVPKPIAPIRSRRRLATPCVAFDQRAAERARAEDRGDQAERLGAGVQRAVGKQRQQHVEVERERRQHEDHRERDARALRPADVAQRLARTATKRRAPVARRLQELRLVERQQRQPDGEKADRVEREADARPCERDHRTADRRSEDPRHGSQAGRERDRVVQVLRPDHLKDQRVPGRAVERVDDALDDREEVELPDGDRAAQRQRRERDRGDHRDELAADRGAAHVEPVDQRTDEQPGPVKYSR